MVNQVNVEKAIAIMLRAKEHNSVYMNSYQDCSMGETVIKTEAELHACGNKACFAGHVAISPEFQADGGYVDEFGRPVYKNKVAYSAIKEWLGISEDLAYSLVYGSTYYDYKFSNFYNKPWDEVNADDVLEKLYMIQRGELE